MPPATTPPAAEGALNELRALVERKGQVVTPPSVSAGLWAALVGAGGLLRQPMLEGACIRACAVQGCGLLEFGLAALQPMLEGACIRAWPNWVLYRRVGDWWC
jgi:hypothetical protein